MDRLSPIVVVVALISASACCKRTSAEREVNSEGVSCSDCFLKPKCATWVNECRDDSRCKQLYNCWRKCDNLTDPNSPCVNGCLNDKNRDDAQLGYKAGFVWGCMGHACRECSL